MNFITKRKLLHLFFPNRCPVCGEIIGAMDGFCGICESKLNIFTEEVIIPGADSFSAPFIKDSNTDPAIYLMKDGIAGNAPYAFGGAMTRLLEEKGILPLCDIIAPAPMTKTDIKKRGYNQSLLIAQDISRRTGIPVFPDLIIKEKTTLAQKTLDRSQRMLNLKGAFRVNESADISGKRILLTDDVCTTGSTLSEIALTLKKGGASQIHCVCCCKTAKGDNNGNEPL